MSPYPTTTDRKALRRELIKARRATTGPLVEDLKQSAMAIPSSAAHAADAPLRPKIAASIKPVARLSGQRTGVSVKAKKTSDVRGFSMAARRMNRKTFRHRVFGRDVWVNQTGQPNWWDDTVKGRRDEIKRDVMKAVEELVELLAKRTKGNHPR